MKALTHKRISADGRLGKGMDMALTTIAFLGLGYLLDRWLGTRPVFMIAMFAVAFTGQVVKVWYDYEARMKTLEADRREHRRSVR